MVAIEGGSPALKDILPDDYARQYPDQSRLGLVIDIASNIEVGDSESRSVVVGHGPGKISLDVRWVMVGR